jgi:hypothetical protein
MWLIALGVLGGGLVLVLAGLHNQAAILRDWEMVLSPWGEDVYRELKRRIEGESGMADHAYRKAFRAKAAGSFEEAIRLLEVGVKVVESTSPDMITLLRGMAVVSRMAAAITAVEPLCAQDFRLPRLSGLVLLAGFLHRLLVSTAERFRLRVYVLRRGFGVATHLLLESTRQIRARRLAAEAEWNRIEAARTDLRTLSAESLRTFHVLLRSLAAEPREGAVSGPRAVCGPLLIVHVAGLEVEDGDAARALDDQVVAAEYPGAVHVERELLLDADGGNIGRLLTRASRTRSRNSGPGQASSGTARSPRTARRNMRSVPPPRLERIRPRLGRRQRIS